MDGNTDRLTAGQVAAEVLRARELLEETSDPAAGVDVPAAPIRHSLSPDLAAARRRRGGSVAVSGCGGWNHLHSLGAQVRRLLPHARKAAVLTDAATWGRLGDRVRGSFQAAGLDVHVRELDPSEQVKSLDQASALYDWLLELRLHREDIVVLIWRRRD